MGVSRSKTSPERRLALALVASAVFHALLGGSPTQGLSMRTFRAAPSSGPAVHVRLVSREPEPAAAAVDSEQAVGGRASRTLPRRANREAPVARSEKAAASREVSLDAADPMYYTARELDVYPALASALDLRVQRGVETREVSGWVLLRVDVSAAGTVDAVSVVDATPNAHFEDDALRAFATAQFRPALRNGRPVKSRILVQVDYGNSNAGLP
jgi:TonB family protein